MILKCPIMCFFFNVTFHALCSIDKSEQQIKIFFLRRAERFW